MIGTRVPSTRLVVVNADDFGQSAGINRGVIEACEHGIVTSASLMVCWPTAAAAAAFARQAPLSVGLHVDLGEWCYRRGEWVAGYQRVNLDDANAVEREIGTQLDRCCDLLGRPPTHLDSHQHVHRTEPSRSILIRVAAERKLPLRHFTPDVRYCGEFYGQTVLGQPLLERIEPAALTALLNRLPGGVTELACHPGYVGDLETMYGVERTVELRTLCSPQVRQAVVDAGIRLVSFTQAGSVQMRAP